MKRKDISKPSPEELAAALAAAPETAEFDPDAPATGAGDWDNAIASDSLPELREKLAQRRRGPQKAPTKELITLRISRETLARFRESGPGWQTRIDAALSEWLREHRA